MCEWGSNCNLELKREIFSKWGEDKDKKDKLIYELEVLSIFFNFVDEFLDFSFLFIIINKRYEL